MSRDGGGDAKIRWLWEQVERAREDDDPERARESLERLLADPAVRGTSDEDLAMLSLSQLDLDEGRARDVSLRLADFEWHGVPSPAGLLLASDIYLKLEWFPQAREALEAYLELLPEDLDARRKLGLVLLMSDEDAEAERLLVGVSRRERSRVPATLTYLALLEAKRGRLEESLHLLLQARDLAPFDRRIEHTLLRIEALRVSLKRKALDSSGLSLEDVVAGMVSGMLELHGYSRDMARRAREVWTAFCSRVSPTGRKPAIWAAALEYSVTRSGPHFTQEQLASEYGVSASQLRDHYHALLEAIEPELLDGGNLLTETEAAGSGLSRLVRREELSEVIASAAADLERFSGPGELCDWVWERIEPAGENERREIESFLGYIWSRRTTEG